MQSAIRSRNGVASSVLTVSYAGVGRRAPLRAIGRRYPAG